MSLLLLLRCTHALQLQLYPYSLDGNEDLKEMWAAVDTNPRASSRMFLASSKSCSSSSYRNRAPRTLGSAVYLDRFVCITRTSTLSPLHLKDSDTTSTRMNIFVPQVL
ncbi:hypothetical protein FB451DRAFT_678902 [Mycena latifolia]|nr:hypothetical protein FB451DRAFT_678902 [Mycena latifolia]